MAKRRYAGCFYMPNPHALQKKKSLHVLLFIVRSRNIFMILKLTVSYYRKQTHADKKPLGKIANYEHKQWIKVEDDIIVKGLIC
jgi:hypothetical protein